MWSWLIRLWNKYVGRRPVVVEPPPAPLIQLAAEPQIELPPPPEPEPPAAEPPPPPPVKPKAKLPPRERDVWLTPRKPRKPRSKLLDSTATPRPPKPPRPAVEETEEWDHTTWPIDPTNEDSGVFYFRGALLERLDVYFRCVARMRKADPDAYHLYRQVGGSLQPNRALAALHQLPAFWHDRDSRPGFGCVSFCRTKAEIAEEEKQPDGANCLQLIYFQKLESPPPEVEPVHGNGDVYSVTAYFDDPLPSEKRSKDHFLEKHGLSTGFYLWVPARGPIRLLKELISKHNEITYRAGTNEYRRKTRIKKFTEYIPYKTWDYTDFLKDWHEECNERRAEKYGWDKLTIDQWAGSILAMIANFAQTVDMGVRVTIKNVVGHVAVFTVDMKRVSYFFKDREMVLTERGTRARTFHVVRPHDRTLKNGKVLHLDFSFRGLRRFKWGLYEVLISVPGLHHINMSEFTCPLHFFDMTPPEERRDSATVRQIGQSLAQHVEGVPLREAMHLLETRTHRYSLDEEQAELRGAAR